MVDTNGIDPEYYKMLVELGLITPETTNNLRDYGGGESNTGGATGATNGANSATGPGSATGISNSGLTTMGSLASSLTGIPGLSLAGTAQGLSDGTMGTGTAASNIGATIGGAVAGPVGGLVGNAIGSAAAAAASGLGLDAGFAASTIGQALGMDALGIAMGNVSDGNPGVTNDSVAQGLAAQDAATSAAAAASAANQGLDAVADDGTTAGINGAGAVGIEGLSDSGSGGGSAKVVCTELRNTNRMSRQVWYYNLRYAEIHYSPQVLRGYHAWGFPLVRLMRRLPLAVSASDFVANSMALDAANHYDPSYKPNYLGKFIRHFIFFPLCWTLGLFAKSRNWKDLFN